MISVAKSLPLTASRKSNHDTTETSTPQKYCSNRCRREKPCYSRNSYESVIEGTFIRLLGEGRDRRIVECGEVQREVFGTGGSEDVEQNETTAKVGKVAAEGRDENEGRAEAASETEDEDGGGVPIPIHVAEDQPSRYPRSEGYCGRCDEHFPSHHKLYKHLQRRECIPVASKGGDSVSDSAATKGSGLSSTSQIDEDSAKMGMKVAKQREQVRQAARRGVVFGFVIEGESDSKVGRDGEEGARVGKEGRRKVEAVQNGRVVEASFAKGEWGVRWRD